MHAMLHRDLGTSADLISECDAFISKILDLFSVVAVHGMLVIYQNVPPNLAQF